MLEKFADEAQKAGAVKIGGAIISPEAKRLFDRVFGKPIAQREIQDWEALGDFQPMEADYNLERLGNGN